MLYVNLISPAETKPSNNFNSDVAISQGSSGDDSITFSTDNDHKIYQGLDGNDTVELNGAAHHNIYGGSGNDIIKENLLMDIQIIIQEVLEMINWLFIMLKIKSFMVALEKISLF